ncbi:ACT domain-containing protein [Pendulispora rubella]|uniref:ACT domain-containing protein n=1 Tax=Pendulispora rubella TaxID=2741070 RepID=A0ABZ2L5V0_9BACT
MKTTPYMAMMGTSSQRLRFLPGRFQIDHHPTGHVPPVDVDWLVMVRAPDGLTVVRHAEAAPAQAWLALYSGDTAHELEATGMLSALLVPLKDAGISVFVGSTFEADVVLVPEARRDDAVQALRRAGHHVA